MTNTHLKWYSSANLYAPKLDNTFGAVVNLLKKCLIEGFGEVYSSNVSFKQDLLTITFEQAHGFLQHQLIELSGTGYTAVDGIRRVTEVVDSNTVVVQLNEIVAITLTETIIAKLPPLGWEQLYDNENRAVFKTTAFEGPNHCLFVQNNLPTGYSASWLKYANLGLAESWGDDETPKGLTNPQKWSDLNPTGRDISMTLGYNKIFHNISSSYDIFNQVAPTYGSSEGNCEWYLVGDNSYYYLINSLKPGTNHSIWSGMGQYDCIHAGYQYNTFLSAMTYHAQTANASASLHLDFSSLGSASRSLYTLSGYNNTDNRTLMTSSYTGIVNTGSSNILSPGGPVNFFKVYVRDSSHVLMGTLKNIYWLALARPYNNKQIFKQGSNIYLAVSTYFNSADVQAVFKIGED